MHSRACLISIENTTAESFHSPRTKGSVQMILLFLTELFTELSPVLRTRRSCRQFSFPLLGQKYNMKLKMYFKRESWPRQQGIHFNIKEQTSNLNTQQENIHLKETSNRFKTLQQNTWRQWIYRTSFSFYHLWGTVQWRGVCAVSSIKYFIIWYKGINVVWIQKAVDLKAEQSVVLISASIGSLSKCESYAVRLKAACWSESPGCPLDTVTYGRRAGPAHRWTPAQV